MYLVSTGSNSLVSAAVRCSFMLRRFWVNRPRPQRHRPLPVPSAAACDAGPWEDATALLCASPSSVEEARAAEVRRLAAATIPLTLEKGTPLRIAVDQRTRVSRAGEVVHGKVVETVYAFDQQVIPAGSVATGHVKSIAPVPGLRRGMAYANGDFSPFTDMKSR